MGVTAPIPTSVGPPTVAIVPQQQQQMQSALAQQQLPLLQQQQVLPEMQNMLQQHNSLQQQPGGLDVKLMNGTSQPDAAGPPVMLVRGGSAECIYTPRAMSYWFTDSCCYTRVCLLIAFCPSVFGHLLEMLSTSNPFTGIYGC